MNNELVRIGLEAVDANEIPRLDSILTALIAEYYQHSLWEPQLQSFIYSLLHGDRTAISTKVLCWQLVFLAIGLDPTSLKVSPAQVDTIVKELKLFALIKEGLLSPESTEELKFILLFVCSSLALEGHFTLAFCVAGIPDIFISQIPLLFPSPLSLTMLIFLANLSLFPSSHEYLTSKGIVSMAQSFLPHLRAQRINLLDAALSSSFILIRIQQDAFCLEDILVHKMRWILTQVLVMGPNGVVLGCRWNVANILLDLSLLTLVDKNKCLLLPFIPLVSRALTTPAWSSQQWQIARYALRFLVEMLSEPQAVNAMDARVLLPRLDKLLLDFDHLDLETRQNAMVLFQELSGQPRKNAPGVLGKMFSWFVNLLPLRLRSEADEMILTA